MNAYVIYGWCVNSQALFSRLKEMPPELFRTTLRVVMTGTPKLILGTDMASTEELPFVSVKEPTPELREELRRGLRTLGLMPEFIPEDKDPELWLIADSSTRRVSYGPQEEDASAGA